MQVAKNYITDIANHTEQALKFMPVRSSIMARQMVGAALPVPKSRNDIERYVYALLNHKEQQVCDMATD